MVKSNLYFGEFERGYTLKWGIDPGPQLGGGGLYHRLPETPQVHITVKILREYCSFCPFLGTEFYRVHIYYTHLLIRTRNGLDFDSQSL